MALGHWKAQALGIGGFIVLASLLFWLSTRQDFQLGVFWQTHVLVESQETPNLQKESAPNLQKELAFGGDGLEDHERPRPREDDSLEEAKPNSSLRNVDAMAPKEASGRAEEAKRFPTAETKAITPRPPHGGAWPFAPNDKRPAAPPPPPSPPSASPPNPPPPSPSPPRNCDTSCTWRGYNGTCRRRIQWLVDHKFPDMPQACSVGYSKIRALCPSCSGCSLSAAGCTMPCDRSCTLRGQPASCSTHVQWLAGRELSHSHDACAAASAQVAKACPACAACPTAATGCVKPCEAQCTLHSFTASCRSRIQWLVDHDFLGRPDACKDAHQRVSRECPICKSCALGAASCKAVRHQGPGTSAQRRLLQELYGIKVPNPLKKLPSCAKQLRVFIYDISTTFNADLIRAIAKSRKRSNCDYEITQCHEKRWDPFFSVMRSCAGEVPLLLKFLSMPQITENAEEADLFVVPWFGALDKIVMKQPWGGGDSKTHQRTKEVIAQLPHMKDPRKAKRHVFLSSIDHDDVDTALLYRVRAGALLLHYGPSAGPDEIVVVPSGAGFGAPLEPLVHPAPNFLFYMAGAVNRYRHRMDRELWRLRDLRPNLKIVHPTMQSHRKLSMTPAETQQAMSRSLLCPIAQGDLPFQHRFFDALASGCLPVVIRYSQAGKCDTWSWIYTQGFWGKYPRPCVHSTYPLTSSISYEDIVVQVPAEDFQEGRFAEVLLRLDMPELERKRRRLESIRHLFVYDRTGETYDAFSGALQEICKAIGVG